MAKVSFIGLGIMGFPMAGHLTKAGHEVCVYNRTTAKADAWKQSNAGTSASTPQKCAEDADFVFCCVGNDDDLRSVTLDDGGAFASLKKGAVFIDHTTASADIARELAQEAKKRDAGFLDAPVSGGQAGAQNGVLSIMVGGDEETFARSKPIMEAYGKTIGLMGPVGSGQLSKMVNQICIAGLVQGLAEGVNFAKKAGLDGEKLFDTISGGAAGSWQMVNRNKTMLSGEYDFGFAVDWMRKDLKIALEQGAKIGAEIPIVQIVDGFYEEVQQMGGNRWDTSSLLARLDKSNQD